MGAFSTSNGERVDWRVGGLAVNCDGHELHRENGGLGEGEGFETGVVGGVHRGGEDVTVVVDDPALQLVVDLFEAGELVGRRRPVGGRYRRRRRGSGSLVRSC